MPICSLNFVRLLLLCFLVCLQSGGKVLLGPSCVRTSVRHVSVRPSVRPHGTTRLPLKDLREISILRSLLISSRG